MEKNLELKESGLKCDNTECDWRDDSVVFDNYKEWINKPCPKCGENVLTEEDYELAEVLRKTAEFINSLSEEELKEFNESMGINSLQDLKDTPMFKDAKGMDTVKDEGTVSMTISSHKKIKVDEIKNLPEE